MSETPSVPPPPPPPPEGGPPAGAPFPRPFDAAPKSLPGGCSKPVFVGCAVILVVIGILGIVFVANAKRFLAWTFGQVESQIVAALPEEVTAEERARLERGFDAAVAKMQSGTVETPALYALQSQMMSAAEKAQNKQLTHDDVLDLLSALERVGGLLEPEAGEGEGGPPAPAPAPATEDSPEAQPADPSSVDPPASAPSGSSAEVGRSGDLSARAA